MRKIILKLEQLCGLTWSNSIINLELKCEQQGRTIAILNETNGALLGRVSDLIARVNTLEDPNWNKTWEERIEMIHESETTAVYKVLGTQYVIARDEEKDGYWVVMGKYRLNTEPYETIQEALKDADRQDWTRQMELTQLQIESTLTTKKLELCQE